MNKIKNLYDLTLGRVDARYLVIINHIILLVSAIFFLDLRRSWEQVVFVLVVAIVTELVLSRITLKQKTFDVKSRIISSTVLALSTLLLIRSSFWWFYGLIAVVGVLSKYVLVNHEGRHVYNPTNVAIVFGLIVFPEFVNVRIDSFSANLLPLLCIVFFGTIAIIRANSWRLTLGYFGGIIIFGFPFALIMDYPFLLVFGPEMNAAVVLFAFLMITDPQTSPRVPHLQWIFGLLVAAVNLFLRYEQLYYSQFMALFIVVSFSILLTKFWGAPPKEKLKIQTP